jgi:hypothetical protein
VKAGPTQRGRKPWREKGPGELRARFQSKPLDRVADSGVEQDPVGGSNAMRGTALEDSVRLRERKKALEGGPQERIRHETRPAGSRRMKAPGG